MFSLAFPETSLGRKLEEFKEQDKKGEGCMRVTPFSNISGNPSYID